MNNVPRHFHGEYVHMYIYIYITIYFTRYFRMHRIDIFICLFILIFLDNSSIHVYIFGKSYICVCIHISRIIYLIL